MIIGVLSVKNHRYHPNRRLLEAASGLGHEVVLVHPKRIFMSAGTNGNGIGHLGEYPEIDILMPRIGSTIKDYALIMVRHFQNMGIKVINGFESILLARNKFLALQTISHNGLPVPETRYVSNPYNLRRASKELGGFPLVIKTTTGRQGSGVFLAGSSNEAISILKEHSVPGKGMVLQSFISAEGRRDIRVLIAGEKVLGAMSMRPRKGDFRSNVHLYSKTDKLILTKDMTDLAVKATKSLGLDISGVDMIENNKGDVYVIEANYTPGFRGLEKCTGIDIASKLINFMVKQKRCIGCR